MTSKEALEIILKHVSNLMVEGKSDISLEEIVKAKEVLRKPVERDTPMKPKMSFGIVCSVCHSTLDIRQLKEVNFCPKCGQRIDWSE